MKLECAHADTCLSDLEKTTDDDESVYAFFVFVEVK